MMLNSFINIIQNYIYYIIIQKNNRDVYHITDFIHGAGEGNRTLLSSLGSSHSTDELRPHDVHIVSYINLFIQVKLIILYIPIVVIVLYYYSNGCIK